MNKKRALLVITAWAPFRVPEFPLWSKDCTLTVQGLYRSGWRQASEDIFGLRDVKSLNADEWGWVGLMAELWGRWTAERRGLWLVSNGIPGFPSTPGHIQGQEEDVYTSGSHDNLSCSFRFQGSVGETGVPVDHAPLASGFLDGACDWQHQSGWQEILPCCEESQEACGV